MLRLIKYAFLLFVLLFVFAFLHYTLPQRDVVQIVGTEIKRMDLGENPWFWAQADAGTNQEGLRDVRFINAKKENGKPQVYRNEDTGFGWPPYMKFDSGDMNAEAQALAKTEGEQWAVVTHYGWRSKYISIFPNATSIRAVDSPNVTLFPWFNILVIMILLVILFVIWRFFRKLKNRITGRGRKQIEKA